MASLEVSEGGYSSLSACAWLVLWKEGSWRASASFAGWGMPCPSGAALASQGPGSGPRLLCPRVPSPDIPSGSEGERA